MKQKQILQKASRKLRNASPTILTCVATIGVVATAVLAVRATPKAFELMSEEQNRKMREDETIFPELLTPVEIVRTTWVCYIPAVFVGVSTISCIFGINILNKRNQASLASAYAMLNQSYQKYRKAANTVYGEDADSKIKAQMAKDVYISNDGYLVYSPELDADRGRIIYMERSQKHVNLN